MTIPVGLYIRNMGVESTPALMRHCTLEAEKAGFHSLWITDHIAIPPDDAEGSGGRYMDPLPTLAWLGGQTERIKLGTGVLVLPYRPKVSLTKSIATIQELLGGRLILGVGIGWMKPEFDAVGVPLKKRVSVSEETLQFLNDYFANDVVEANGQPFLTKPHPEKPLVLVGGGAPHATERALNFADGWVPMTTNPEKLQGPVTSYKERAKDGSKPSHVYAFGSLGDDRASVQTRLGELEDIGVDAVVTGVEYTDEESFSRALDELVARVF